MGGRILSVLATNNGGDGGGLLAGRVGSRKKGKLGKDEHIYIEEGDNSPFKTHGLMMDTTVRLIEVSQRADMKWKEDLNMA